MAASVVVHARIADRDRSGVGELRAEPVNVLVPTLLALFLLLAAGARRSTRREWWRFAIHGRGPPVIVSQST